RHQDERVSPAPAAAAGVPGAAELATPEGAAEHLPDPQAGAGVSPGHSGHAGVFPVVEPDHVHANGTDPANGTDVADDGGGDDEGDEDEPDENEPDENEPDDSNDALDEMTHDNDSNGDSGDSGDAGDAGDSASPNAGAAPPPADSGDIPDDLPAVDGAPVDEPGADATYPGGGADQAQLASWMA